MVTCVQFTLHRIQLNLPLGRTVSITYYFYGHNRRLQGPRVRRLVSPRSKLVYKADEIFPAIVVACLSF